MAYPPLQNHEHAKYDSKSCTTCRFCYGFEQNEDKKVSKIRCDIVKAKLDDEPCGRYMNSRLP